MSLVLEIEHLLGVAFGARAQESEVPDWPPQPDRVFSALAASWGARGERAEEQRALEWLEAQPAAEIAASGGHPRTAPIVFVPPNDAEGGRVGNEQVLPSLRRRQPRRFPAFRPVDATVFLSWCDVDADPATLAALNALAADTAYVGHSASLTRCRFYNREGAPAGGPARRRVYRGRLAELKAGFDTRPLRRPGPGAPIGRATEETERAQRTAFSENWLVLEHVAGEMPDIRAGALIAKRLRDTIMSGYGKAGLGDAIPTEVSGHGPNGKPSSEAHLAIAPMAFLGWPHASGNVLGFALIPPHDGELFANPGFQRAFRAVLHPHAETDRRELRVEGAGFSLTLAPGGAERRSLDPARYCTTSKIWASAAPIVLDRHLKATGNEAREEEIGKLLARACSNIGLPVPIRVAWSKHGAIEGSPSAYPSGREPRWMRWRVPESLASRQLVHAVVEFAEPVRGPVILGAGRFVGLGLCLPLNDGWRQ